MMVRSLSRTDPMLRSPPLAISVKLCYIACMSKQNAVEPSDEQQKTRERIITATSKVLAEKGYDATTLREISREAQVAPDCDATGCVRGTLI